MVGILSDTGNVRHNNEDYVGFYENEEYKIYLVADGMGGYNSGEVASKIAVEEIIEYIKNNFKVMDTEEIVINAIKEANKAILKAASDNSAYKGMGTTVTCCFLHSNYMVVGHVGDSSCFIIQKKELSKLTKDHSLVQQLLDSGSITEEQAAIHPNKNIITRALGTNEDVEVDIYSVSLNGISKVILCTDGLSNYITKNDMLEIILNNQNDESAKELIDLGKKNGSRDNLSVIVFEGECIK